MLAADEGPKTEAALLLDLPPSNRPGVFPRDLLPGGERVLYETRPSLYGLYGGRLIILLLLEVLWVGLAVASPSQAAPGAAILAVPTTIPLVYWVLVWQKTAYALTDRRVLLVTGLRQTEFQEATYAQVQNLSLENSSGGGIKFDATPPNAPHTLIGTRKFVNKIVWKAVPSAGRVLSFVQEAFALHEREAAQAGLRDALVARMTENRFPCEYCRTLVDIRTVDFASPKCPSCGAPLVAPSK